VYAWLEGDMMKNHDLIREEALEAGFVEQMTLSSQSITNNHNSTTDVTWPGKGPTQHVAFDAIGTDFDFIATHAIRIMEGRGFSQAYASDSAALLLNEEAVKVMGLKQPIGARVTLWGEERHVVGVFRNFIWGSPFQHIPPMVVAFKVDILQVVTARLNSAKPAAEAVAGLQRIIKKHNPAYPAVDFQFVDVQYANKFKLETQVGSLATAFTVLAIFVSCLGLFGLAAFTAEQRTREIGIRKVLGARLPALAALLMKDFLKLTAIALLVGSPMAWYFTTAWLQKYDQRTDVSWWLFGLTGLLLLLITLVTVGWQAVKAALANPVDSLKSE
jgi:predicted lysophospholipase L1 biosynthesis ABC-type transport system permease subunit